MTPESFDGLDNLSDLRDDGGRPLPATPQEMLARAERTHKRRRILTTAGSGLAAFALLAGGVAVAAQIQDRQVETAQQPTPAATDGQAEPAPVPSTRPVPEPAEEPRGPLPSREVVDAAVEAVREGLYVRASQRLPMPVAGVTPEYRSGEVSLVTYAGVDSDEVYRRADQVLRQSGYFAKGVRLIGKSLGMTHEEHEGFHENVRARTESVSHTNLTARILHRGLGYAVVATPGNVAPVQKAYAEFGVRVLVVQSDVTADTLPERLVSLFDAVHENLQGGFEVRTRRLENDTLTLVTTEKLATARAVFAGWGNAVVVRAASSRDGYNLLELTRFKAEELREAGSPPLTVRRKDGYIVVAVAGDLESARLTFQHFGMAVQVIDRADLNKPLSLG